jgi:hypothetical protein
MGKGKIGTVLVGVVQLEPRDFPYKIPIYSGFLSQNTTYSGHSRSGTTSGGPHFNSPET